MPVKTTLDLPNDLVREVKLRAVNEEKKLKDVISELLRRGLGQGPTVPTADLGRRGQVGIPLFPSKKDAPAARRSVRSLITAEYETLTREDLERHRPSA